MSLCQRNDVYMKELKADWINWSLMVISNTPPDDDIPKLVEQINHGYDYILGSRYYVKVVQFQLNGELIKVLSVVEI